MPINPYNKCETVSVSKSYVDLRHLADDKTVLENPHKGWYYHFVDNGLKRPVYRDRLTEVKKFRTPCMNHLYLRMDWADIEGVGEGKYDFSYIDKIMDEWSPLGYKFALRFCCYEPWLEYAAPKWLFELGIAHTRNEFKKEDGTVRYAYEPDYNDPVFLQKLENFLRAAAEKYDGDERIESLDIGTFGTYGEGHTSSGSDKIYPASVLKKHINLHLKYFKNTHLIINDDFIQEAWNQSPEDASEIYDYCIGKGLGLRDDSICVKSYVEQFGYNTMRHPTFFSHFAENAPVDIEFCHIFHNIPERFKEGLPIIEALKTAHATYAGFHGYEEDWYEKTEYLTDYLTNRLGYWFFVDGVDAFTPTEGSVEMCKLIFANRGFAKCYNKYRLELRLRDKDGRLFDLNCEPIDTTLWESGSVNEVTVRLDYRAVPHGEYSFELGLFSDERPIKLALKEELLLSDGYYKLTDVKVSQID